MGPEGPILWCSQVQFTMGLASLTIGCFHRYVDNIASIPHPPHTHPAPGIMFRGPGGRLMIRTICGGAEPKATRAFWSDPHEAGSGGTGRRVTAHLRVLEAPGAGGGNPHWKIHAEAEVAAFTCHRPCCAGGPGCARRVESTDQERGGDRRPETAAPAASEAGLSQAAVNQGPLPSDATGRHRPRGGDLVDLTATVPVS